MTDEQAADPEWTRFRATVSARETKLKSFTLLAVALVVGLSMSTSGVAGESSAPSTTEQRNINSLRTLFAAINEGRQAQAAATIADPNFVRHDLTGAVPGVEGQDGAVRFIDSLRAGVPDLRLEIEDIFAAGDKVAVRFAASGTHSGKFLGHAASGKQIRINNINIYRFEAGRIVETWQLADGLGLANQVQARR